MSSAQAPVDQTYADTLRALGHHLDSALYRDITLVESEVGLVVKGCALGDAQRRAWHQTRSDLFTLQHLAALRQAASVRRNRPIAPEEQVPSIRLGEARVRYEDSLRAVGHFIDRAGWRDIVVIQTADYFYIKGRSATPSDEPVACTLDARALADLTTGLRLRRSKRIPQFTFITC